jgi:hypothetical protein
MAIFNYLFVASSGVLILTALAIVAMAVRAYRQTANRSLIHLSLGFSLVVAAAAATTISALALNFTNVRSLLLINSGFTSFGYVFVFYSLVSY